MTTQFDIQPDSQTLIAPLIFISLIENAFKHGISPTESSFISIHILENDNEWCVKSAIVIILRQWRIRVDRAWDWNKSADGWRYFIQGITPGRKAFRRREKCTNLD